MKLRKPHQGHAIAYLTVMTGLLFAALATASQVWSFQFGVTANVINKDAAKRLAESAAHVAVAQILKDPHTSPGLVDITLPSFEGGHGYVTFSSGAQPSAMTIPVSVNNLEGKSSVPGWSNRVVPAENASIVAVGHYRGLTTKSEVILHVPAYPYVIASTAPIIATDALQVFGVRSAKALLGGFSAITPDQKSAGHVATNAFESTLLSGNKTDIQGDVQSRGKIIIDNGALVRGEVRPESDAIPMPIVDVTSFDTNTKPETNNISASALNALTMSGFNRSKSLTINNGLKLDSGVLYVEGDLQINGGLSGKGAIFATGKVTIIGGTTLAGEHQAAILAKGGLTIEGNPSDPSECRGLLYTEGDLVCRNANVAGGIVVKNPSAGGKSTLEKTRMAEVREFSTLTMEVKTLVKSPTTPPFLKPLEVPLSLNGILDNRDPIKANPVTFFANRDQSNPLFNPNTGRFEIPKNLPSDLFTWTSGSKVSSNFTPSGTFSDVAFTVAPTTDFKTAAELRSIVLTELNRTTHFTTPDGKFYIIGDPSAEAAAAREADRLKWNAMFPQAPLAPDTNIYITADQFKAKIAASADSVVTNAQAELKAGLEAALALMNSGLSQQIVGDSPEGTVREVTRQFNLDLSKFFKLSERVRILSWREV